MDGVWSKSQKDGEWFMTEKCDVWSKPEKDGGWSKSEKEGVYSKPEKEGVYSKPEKGGICSTPERDDVCSKPEKDSNTNSALTLVPVCPLPSRWFHTPLNTGGGKRRELSPVLCRQWLMEEQMTGATSKQITVHA